METQGTFQRVEKKYLLTDGKVRQLKERLLSYVQQDQYGRHTICNIYYDTDRFDLIRRSIEKPPYKEKLRLRSYGIPDLEDRVFLEIKKKCKGVVYKRRISLTLKEAKAYLEYGRGIRRDGQIEQEIDYFIQFYQPKPKIYIAYDREAYFAKEDPSFRITFDQNIRSREEDLELELGDAGKLLMDEGYYLMEVKAKQAYPLWFVKQLSQLAIYPISFSKYGMIYQNHRNHFMEHNRSSVDKSVQEEVQSYHSYGAVALF